MADQAAPLVEVASPLETSGWDEWALGHENVSFFHSSWWASVLSRCYGFPLRYVTLVEAGRPTSVMPMAEVTSPLTGRRGVGLPFSDICPPLTERSSQVTELFSAVIEHGRRAGWKYFEIRGGLGASEAFPSACHFHVHVLDLERSSEELFASFKDATRRNVRKAEREGVECEVSDSLDAFWSFHRMFCETRRRHGLPPPPRRFFRMLHDVVIAPGHGRVALARHRGRPVAGAVFGRFGAQALFKYGGSDMQSQHLRAVNLLFWEAIRFYRDAGCRTLSFGRTEPFNEGLRRFKLGWGTREERLDYHRYDFRRNAFVEAPLRFQGWHNAVFSRLPMPLLEWAGTALYRHVA
jgi:Acetyltransferase (GNAT) domain